MTEAVDTLPLHDAGTARVTSPILPDVVDEARRLLAAAEEDGLRLRLIGGVAVRLHVQGELHPAFAREIRDIDVVTGKGQGRRAGAFFEAQGYAPNRTFNAMHGARRMLFYDERQRQAARRLRQHVRDVPRAPARRAPRARPDHGAARRPAADEAADRHAQRQGPLRRLRGAARARARLRRRRVHRRGRASPTSARATGVSTARCRSTSSGSRGALPQSGLSDDDQRAIAARIAGITAAIEAAPKSVKWKARARVGDRVRWYEEPDEVDQGGY